MQNWLLCVTKQKWFAVPVSISYQPAVYPKKCSCVRYCKYFEGKGANCALLGETENLIINAKILI